MGEELLTTRLEVRVLFGEPFRRAQGQPEFGCPFRLPFENLRVPSQVEGLKVSDRA